MQTRTVNVGGRKPTSSFQGLSWAASMYPFTVVKTPEEKVNDAGRSTITVTLQLSSESEDGTVETGEAKTFIYLIVDEDAFRAAFEKDPSRKGKDINKSLDWYSDNLVRFGVCGGMIELDEDGKVPEDAAEVDVSDEWIMSAQGFVYFWPAGTEGGAHDGGPSKYSAIYLLTPDEVTQVETEGWAPKFPTEMAPRTPQGATGGRIGGGAQVNGGSRPGATQATQGGGQRPGGQARPGGQQQAKVKEEPAEPTKPATGGNRPTPPRRPAPTR